MEVQRFHHSPASLIYLVPWNEKLYTARQRISVMINLSSGTHETFDICVLSSIMTLKLRLQLLGEDD